MSSYKPIYYDDNLVSYKNKAKDVMSTYASPRALASVVVDYLLSLIPIITWIRRYNLTWATGDIIAGITIGAIVVPQGMAYAKVCTLVQHK
jgi:sodium-independent sulfate anion transporter 11